MATILERIASGLDALNATSAAAARKPQAATTAADEHAPKKERLYKLVTWLIATAGAVATVLVAGSQLSSIGSLDDQASVSIFSWHQTRFEFAVIGLASALGGIAISISLAVWVQTTNFVTLDSICRWPTEGYGVVGWGVKRRVRLTIERDLERRGVPGAALPGTGYVGLCASRWKNARALEHRSRPAIVALERELHRLRTPKPTNSPQTVPQWTCGTKLVELAQSLAEHPPSGGKALNTDATAALAALEAQSEKAWNRVLAEKNESFELVRRILADASYLRLAYSFRMVLKYLVTSFVVTGMGIAMFAWASHPPEEADPRDPAVVLVRLESGALPALLLDGCDGSSLSVTLSDDLGLAVVSATAATPDEECVITIE